MGGGSVRNYDFTEQFAYSEGVANDGHLEIILRDRIPQCMNVTRATEIEDRSGTDYWAHRGGGLRPLSIDLKARAVDPLNFTFNPSDDVALETWSVIGQKVGWTRDESKTTDYILWFWQPTRRFLLIPFPPLCKVFQRYWKSWREQYEVPPPQNSGGWQSECVYVPRLVLLDKLRDWMNGKV